MQFVSLINNEGIFKEIILLPNRSTQRYTRMYDTIQTMYMF